jgi:hypothetical protein
MNPLRRLAAALVLFALSLGVLAADEPAPLLKPVTPTGNTVRVRFPVDGKSNLTASQFKAQVPAGRGKGKKAEMIDVTVSLDTLPSRSYVALKKWQSWGYEVPANKVGLLPELVIAGSQLAPKASKRDVLIRIPSVSLEIIDPPGGSDTVYGSDLAVSIRELTKNNDRVMEPRYYFTPQFLELSVLGTSLRRPGTDDGTPPEPTLTKEPAGLVPVSGPTVVRGLPVFAYAAVNGISQYKTPDGRDEWVNVGVTSYSNWKGLYMTLGTARGCGVEMEDGKDLTAIGANFEAMIGKGKLKEFRLGFLTGPGLKTPKDLVLKDVPVFIDKNNSEHFVCLGPELINEYLKDAVYAFGPDGWRLHARAKAEYLQDITTRTPPKKK